ncbi:MAG: NAD(P)/FAD-dependent oxidoreductase [Pseudomonadota bacterium]|nr:NAD(P)/FAD-dependent oxidoreductase [Rubrivivax sp.]
MDQVDVLVVGAGVVGLAAARALASRGRDVIVAEAAPRYGSGVSSRSSEVVHAGLYYEPGSLKARLCVQGRELLYAYCRERGVAHARCGKLVVATRPQDEGRLEAIRARAHACGADAAEPLAMLTAAQARALEPELQCSAALLSPRSGIVDSHGLMTALLADTEAAGGLLACASRIEGAEPAPGGWRIAIGADDTRSLLQARWIVNAAGLDAQAVARSITGFPDSSIPQRHLAKGHYFDLAGKAPFARLIYPTPVGGGLGVHLTLDLGGGARFGPDVQWLDAVGAETPAAALDHAVDPARAAAFYAEVRRYWPRLPDSALQPAYAGIRPKLAGAGAAAADFRIDGPATHGVDGLVHLFGIESPGLTSALAIGEVVAALVCD